jgi:fructokinase
VTVKDTVGSGDSFLAAFLAKKVQNKTPEEGMIYATALGAFVAAHEGACPSYDIAQIKDFQLQHSPIF